MFLIYEELSPVHERRKSEQSDLRETIDQGKKSSPKLRHVSIIGNTSPGRPRSKSTSGNSHKAKHSRLSLSIPNTQSSEGIMTAPIQLQSPGASSNSSRDGSPSRTTDMGLLAFLRPPLVIEKGPRGFGFSLKSVRVYYGESGHYIMQHLVGSVEGESPAFEAGLRVNHVITHVNEKEVIGKQNTDVIAILLSCRSKVTLRTVPIEQTHIKVGKRKHGPLQSKMIRRRNKLVRTSSSASTKGRRSGGRSHSFLKRLSKSSRGSEELNDSSASSSSPTSSSPSSPASFSRPSSLSVVKHQRIHGNSTGKSPRRQSVHNIPLSPLARPSSPALNSSVSPTRSTSPLTVSHGPPPGISNCPQTYSPSPQGQGQSGINMPTFRRKSSGTSSTRPKSVINESNSNSPGASPLLRRTLSPDLLHPNSSCTRHHRLSMPPKTSSNS